MARLNKRSCVFLVAVLLGLSGIVFIGLRAGSGSTLNGVRDFLVIGQQDVVLVDYLGNAHASRDGCKTWKSSGIGTVPQELTQDAQGAIWGIYGWKGIHEPSSADICRSNDGGGTWKVFPMNPPRFIPAAFVSLPGSDPVILDTEGGLWQRDSQDAASADAWKRLGAPVPDKKGVCGILRDSTIYVAGRDMIWLSLDGGRTWTGKSLAGVRLSILGNRCWAVDGGGRVYRTPLGTLGWEYIATIQDASLLFRIVAVEDRIVVAGEDQRGAAGAWVVGKDGVVKRCGGVIGTQCTSVRITADGKALFGGERLFRECKNDVYEPVWP